MAEDKFANYAIIQVAESAANTLTFKKLETGISIQEKVAWIINRIEYVVSFLTAAVFNSDSDLLQYGLAVSNSFTTPTLTEETIFDFNTVQRLDYGAAASGFIKEFPFVKDLSTLPGGGLIIPPVPLYLWAKGTGLASADTVTAKLYFTLKQLKVDEYWELVEARRVLSS